MVTFPKRQKRTTIETELAGLSYLSTVRPNGWAKDNSLTIPWTAPGSSASILANLLVRHAGHKVRITITEVD